MNKQEGGRLESESGFAELVGKGGTLRIEAKEQAVMVKEEAENGQVMVDLSVNEKAVFSGSTNRLIGKIDVANALRKLPNKDLLLTFLATLPDSENVRAIVLFLTRASQS